MNKVAGGNQVEKTSKLRTYDQTEVQQRMTKLRAEVAQKKAAEAKRAEEIAAVQVSDADVSVIADALNLSTDQAKRRLQEKNGDVVAVLREAAQLPKSKA